MVDVETGEILTNKDQRKNYITIKIEVSKTEKNGYKIETTTRIVKHNGQQTIEI